MASWGIPLPAGKLHPNLSDRFYFYNSLYFIKYGCNEDKEDEGVSTQAICLEVE
jgi:hypothetical protein